MFEGSRFDRRRYAVSVLGAALAGVRFSTSRSATGRSSPTPRRPSWTRAAHGRRPRRPTGRADVAAETTWVRRGGDTVTAAIIEAIADAERVEPTEVDLMLYDHVDPDAVAPLVTPEGSPWQLTSHTGRYEVRVSSYGAVTVFDRRRGVEPPSIGAE